MEYKTLIGVLTVSLLLAVPAVVAMEPEEGASISSLTRSTFDPATDFELVEHMRLGSLPNATELEKTLAGLAAEELTKRAFLRKKSGQMPQYSEPFGKSWSFWDYFDWRTWRWFSLPEREPIFEDVSFLAEPPPRRK